MRGQLNYLNNSQCKAAKPRDKEYRLNDGGGMYLLVRPNGSKLWRMKYTVNGKTKLASFGKYPDVELADARDKRSAARKLVAKNIDPNKVKQCTSSKHMPPLELFSKRYFSASTLSSLAC
jgi:hypothetical protein